MTATISGGSPSHLGSVSSALMSLSMVLHELTSGPLDDPKPTVNH